MSDSQRLRSIPEGIRIVSEVAGELAEKESRTSVLAVTTYLPMDVDSVARVFEGLEPVSGVERIQDGSLTVYEFDDPQRFCGEGTGIEAVEFLEEARVFLRAVGDLKRDAEWVRKVQEQHELLHIIAEASEQRLELGYMTNRASMPRARVQSLLNDFDAEGYIGSEVDEEADQLFFTFPQLTYPKERYQRNMSLLEEVAPPARSRLTLWIYLAAFAVILLVVVFLLRF